jgi:transposase
MKKGSLMEKRDKFKEWVKDLSPKEVAKTCGVSTRTVFNWSRRTHLPEMRQIEKIMEAATHLTIEDILLSPDSNLRRSGWCR